MSGPSFLEPCRTCIFWELVPRLRTDGVTGWCHRYPPQLVGETFGDSDDIYPVTHWPEVNQHDSCGEHRERS